MQNKNNKDTFNLDPYRPEFVHLFEILYGANLISLGGLPAIDNIFSDLEINELTALDLGFGLGGVAFYLAEKYKMNIAGIEVHPWMVQYAKDHTPRDLLKALQFVTYNTDGQIPFMTKTFDLVYSKGVLNHVLDKAGLFRQVNAVLKQNGLFVIADWIFPHTIPDNLSPLVCETMESYEQILSMAGFGEIKFRDDSKLFLGYVKKLLSNLSKNQEHIKQKYGQLLFSEIQKQHEELIEKISQHQKFAVRIVARKLRH